MNSVKKFLTYTLLLILGIAVGISASLAVYFSTGEVLFQDIFGTKTKSMSIGAEASSAELTEYAFQIAGYIKDRNYEALSQAVHPELGVVFSPYATINLTSNKFFTVSQVKGLSEDENKYVWGKYDGNGEPIELTAKDYFEKFVFNKDYTLADEIGVDTIVKSGNSLENIKEAFPEVRFVDFHIPGTEASGGLDWSSLRLGFEEYKGVLKLTVIMHSEWTI